jgi:lysophospholipase L1-like esterase
MTTVRPKLWRSFLLDEIVSLLFLSEIMGNVILLISELLSSVKSVFFRSRSAVSVDRFSSSSSHLVSSSDENVSASELSNSIFSDLDVKVQLKKIVEKVEALERLLLENKKEKCNVGVQTTEAVPVQKSLSYAEATKVNIPVTEAKLQTSVDSSASTRSLGELVLQKSKKNTNKESDDVKPCIVNDVRSSQRTHEVTSGPEVPRVLIVADSTAKHIDCARLGHGYGFKAAARKAYKINECLQVVERSRETLKPDPDCVVIHVGINDIKSQSENPMECGVKLAAMAKKVQSMYPKAKVVVSHPTPVRDPKLEGKRRILEATTRLHLSGENINCVSYKMETATQRLISGDDIHPTAAGSSVMAGTLGRRLRGLLWEIPKRRPQRPRPRPRKQFYAQHAAFNQRAHFNRNYSYDPWIIPGGLIQNY